MTDATTPDQSAAMLLELHHRRLDEMLDDVELAADAESWKNANRGFKLFRHELEEHIRLEEEVMFPAFEAATSVREGPTAVMRHEHVAIRALLSEIEQALIEERPISRLVAALESQLGSHNFKEERVLYPAFEQRAPISVRAGLATELSALLRGPG